MRRPVADQVAAAAARHPVVVLVAPRTEASRDLVRAITAGTTWRPPRSLGEEACFAEARADQLRFAHELPARSVLLDADLLPGLPALLAATVADRGSALPGQLLLTVGSRDHAPSTLPAGAVVELRPLTLSERLGGGQACFGSLFDTGPDAWASAPLTETQYLTELLRHDRGPADPDHLAALDLAVLRAVQRRSGTWFERVALAAVVGAHPDDVAGALERLELRGHLRRAPLLAARGTPVEHEGGAADNAGSGQAFGRIVATDVADVARVFSLGGAAVDPEAVTGDARLALVRTGALAELLTQNEWLRRPCEVRTWHAARDHEQVDLVLTRPDGRAIAVSVAATARFDDEQAQAALASLQALRRRHPGLRARLILLYLGPITVPLGRDLYAVPLSMLWSALPLAAGLGFGGFEEELTQAAGQLSLLQGASGMGVEEITRQREQAAFFLDDELLPMLEATVERLTQFGLELDFDPRTDTDPADLATAGAVATLLPPTNPDVLAAAHLTIRPPGGDGGWDAVLVAAAARGGARWWVGQVLPGPQVVGRAGPLSGLDAADADHLLASLVAGIVDAAGLAVRA